MAVLQMGEFVARLEEEARERHEEAVREGNKNRVHESSNEDEWGGSPTAEPTPQQETDLAKRKSTDNRTDTKLAELADVSPETMIRAEFVRDHGTPRRAGAGPYSSPNSWRKPSKKVAP
jgi:hypothetical protein